MITADRVSVRLAGALVVHEQSFEVVPGAVAGLVGPSGRGKTTVLRVLAGLIRPSEGTVRWDGHPRPAAGSVGLLAQHPRLVCNPRWRLGSIVAEPATIRGRRADVTEIATRVGLDPVLLTRYPAQVSDGQLQRACLARILVQRPAYVLCDEPTAMLDPIATADVAAVIRSVAAAGAGVALVSHDRAVIEAVGGDVTELM